MDFFTWKTVDNLNSQGMFSLDLSGFWLESSQGSSFLIIMSFKFAFLDSPVFYDVNNRQKLPIINRILWQHMVPTMYM